MTRAATFRLADVRRAIKATEGSGLSVAGVEVANDGTIRVLTGKASPDVVGPALSPLEAWEAANGLRAA